MADFIDNHPVITGIIVAVLICAIVVGGVSLIRYIPNVVHGGNRQVMDTKYNFQWAIIELGNGELLEGTVVSWCDYADSDAVQVTMEDGTTILTHYSKILLCSQRP